VAPDVATTPRCHWASRKKKGHGETVALLHFGRFGPEEKISPASSSACTPIQAVWQACHTLRTHTRASLSWACTCAGRLRLAARSNCSRLRRVPVCRDAPFRSLRFRSCHIYRR
jgi:hypothetical protein